MKKFLLHSTFAALAALSAFGCSEKAGEAADPEAPNLKGKPAGPRPSPSVGGGGGGGGETKTGDANAKVQVQ